MEKALNLSLALKVRDELTRAGAEVVLSREGDIDVPLTVRVEQAQRVGAAVFLSLHHNSAASSQASGAETFCQARREESRRLASLVQSALVAATGLADRGIKTRLRDDGQDYYYVLRAAPLPAVICEVGFVTSRTDAARLGTATFQGEAARAVAGALLEFVGQDASGPFPDVPAGHWAAQAVAWTAQRGFLVGYPDGLFHGADAVTRYQLAVALFRFSGQQLPDAQHQGEAGEETEG